LEIIGNSKSIPKLQKHFKKMFAGVTSIILNEEEQIIAGISSKEGEEVKLPINFHQSYCIFVTTNTLITINPF
jgi:dynein heavy chain 1